MSQSVVAKSVEVEDDGAGFGRVLVDGEEIHRVRSVTIETWPGEVTKVNLLLVPLNGVKFKGPAEVTTTTECAWCGQELPDKQEEK